MLKKNYFLTFTFLLFFLLSGIFNNIVNKPLTQVSKQDAAINMNKYFLQYLFAGQKMMITDLLWISTLIESDLEHYGGQDLKSWLYLRFDTILSLDPKFKLGYQFGGRYLSIIKDDLIGAKDIFDRGLVQYPQDYRLLYDAAFLYTFELHDYTKGAQLYKKLSYYPEAPKFIHTLVPRLEYELKQDLNLAYEHLLNTYQETPNDTPMKIKLQNDLYGIKAQIDLSCLNNQSLSTCSKVDFEGNNYLYDSKNKLFYTLRKFKEYGLHKKGSP